MFIYAHWLWFFFCRCDVSPFPHSPFHTFYVSVGDYLGLSLELSKYLEIFKLYFFYDWANN